MGITVLDLPDETGRVDLPALMAALGAMEIDGILLEGGGTLNEDMLQKGLVNRVYAYIAPKIFGGREAKTPVEGRGFLTPDDCVHLSKPTVSVLGEDLLLEYEVL